MRALCALSLAFAGLVPFVAAQPAGSFPSDQKTRFVPVGAPQNAKFGTAVALSDEFSMVGAPIDNEGGKVYVWERRPSGSWTGRGTLVASDRSNGDNFGISVGMSGDVLVVGASGDDLGTGGEVTREGSAYVFERIDGTWTQTQKLTALDAESNDRFGTAVAASDDVIVVGAPFESSSTGAVYVFERVDGEWTQTRKLTASDAAQNERFGDAVAVTQTPSGHLVLVGAPTVGAGTAGGTGSAYVFSRALSASAWTEQKLESPDGSQYDGFGEAVDIADAATPDNLNNQIAVIGARGHDIGTATNRGAAYVFRNLEGFVFTDKLVAQDGAQNDHFGSAVAVSGDFVVVGAPDDTYSSRVREGSAYVFELQSTDKQSAPQVAKVTPADMTAPFDYFGSAVDIDGDQALISAPGRSNGTGVAYVFGPAQEPQTGPQFVVNSTSGGSDGFCGSDGSTAAGDCTFLDALAAANDDGVASTIVFDPTVFAGGATIVASSTPRITTPMTIDGTANGLSAGDVIIDGPDDFPNASLLVTGANASGVVVRGLSLVSSRDGLTISNDASDVSVVGNYIGTTPGGSPLGNDGSGIYVTRTGGGIRIGGTDPDDANTIGHNGDGIYIQVAKGVSVIGNFIGTSPDGEARPNSNSGVTSDRGTDVVIGGTNPRESNVIKSNTIGVVVRTFGESPSSAVVLGNTISANSELGIDLGSDGVTPNDGAPDADSGPSGLQNFPDITSATEEDIAFSLASTPSTTFRIEAYASAEPDPSGFGEGARFVSATEVTTDGSGNVAGTLELDDDALALGEWVTMTATPIDGASPSGSGGTSEFSEAVQAALGGVIVEFAVVQQTVSEDVGSVDLVLTLDQRPSADGTATVTLTSGDPEDLGGVTSVTVDLLSGPGAPLQYAVPIPVADDARSEDTEVFVFSLTVDGGGTPPLLVGDRSDAAIIVSDNDGPAVSVTLPIRDRNEDGVEDGGKRSLVVPVGGLTAGEVASEAGADAVFVIGSSREFVAADPDAELYVGQVVVVDVAPGATLSFTGSAPRSVVTFPPVEVSDDEGGPRLVPVGNPTDAPVAVSDLTVEGGGVSDVALVFEDGISRPVSLGGLASGTNRTVGDNAFVLGPFEAVIFQVLPDGDAADVSVTLDTSGEIASGPSLTDAPFVPTDGETAVLLDLRAADAPAGDQLALRFGVGEEDLDRFDGLDVRSLDAPTLAAFGWSDEATMDALFAALSGYDLTDGPVTVPLAVTVPAPGTYSLGLAADAGAVGPRSVVVEVFDGTVGTIVDAETEVTFTVGADDDLVGRFAVRVSLDNAVSTETDPEAFALSAYPNPSSSQVTVTLTTPTAGRVRVAVYDVLGREVAVAHDGPVSSGASRFSVSVGGLSPGAYVVRAEGAGGVAVRSLTVAR